MERPRKPVWERAIIITTRPPSEPTADELRERFRKVIADVGYANPDAILVEWFDYYMENVPAFITMLERYETGQSG